MTKREKNCIVRNCEIQRVKEEQHCATHLKEHYHGVWHRPIMLLSKDTLKMRDYMEDKEPELY